MKIYKSAIVILTITSTVAFAQKQVASDSMSKSNRHGWFHGLYRKGSSNLARKNGTYGKRSGPPARATARGGFGKRGGVTELQHK